MPLSLPTTPDPALIHEDWVLFYPAWYTISMSPLTITYGLAALTGFIATAVATPLVQRLAGRWGALDDPAGTSRKHHTQPIPLLGGLALYAGSTAAILLLKVFELADFSRIPDQLLLGIIGAGGLIMIGGALDDRYNLRPWQQIIWPVAAALIVVLAGVQVSYVTNPFGDANTLILYVPALFGSLIAFAWLMGMMYTTKFLDGLDGLVSGITAIASLFIFIASLAWDTSGSATGAWALALAGAALGFLLFNWHPARIFLGEGGSIWTGFMLGVLSIITGSKIMTTLLVIGIPALDVAWVILVRLWHHQSPFSHADRTHLHFRLYDRGWSVRTIVLLLYAIALLFGGVAVVTTSQGKFVGFLALILVMALLLVTLYVTQRRPDRQ